MATVGQPDLAEYRTRLSQIMPAIVDAPVFKAPGLGTTVPFWVIGRPQIVPSRESARIWRWRVSILFALFRGYEQSPQTIETLADLIDADTVATMVYFQQRNEYISTTLTANQSGYMSGTMSIVGNPDAGYPTKDGQLVGSAYTISFTHRVVYDMEYQ